MNSKRPTQKDESIIAAAVDELWPRIAAWLGDDPLDETDVAEHKQSLADALKWSGGDAYRAARSLENDGWDVDEDLVDELRSVTLWDAEKAAVRAWVASGGVVADLPAGTKVRHPSLDGHVGTIIDPEWGNPRAEGQYLVRCEALGHGVRRGGVLTHGSLLNHEDVEVVRKDPEVA